MTSALYTAVLPYVGNDFQKLEMEPSVWDAVCNGLGKARLSSGPLDVWGISCATSFYTKLVAALMGGGASIANRIGDQIGATRKVVGDTGEQRACAAIVIVLIEGSGKAVEL
jgi:hypothetical protein